MKTLMRMSEERRIRRHLLLRSKKGRLKEKLLDKAYVDNTGVAYSYKWVAKYSSFINVLRGCFKNGFPIVASRLRYNAWAFYPFFFIRRDLKAKDPIVILNHERIHIRQQRDIHITLSLPIVLLCMLAECFGWFEPFLLLCIIPFMPTIIYGMECVRSYFLVRGIYKKITFEIVRENTCFEREAISRSTNLDYLDKRKFWAVVAYTGWECFQNYGIEK